MTTPTFVSQRSRSHFDIFRTRSGLRLAAIAFLSLVLSSAANYFVTGWLGLTQTSSWLKFSEHLPTYRRIGPISGPQVFCAGSSLLVWALSWPKISEYLGQGIEDWTVAGSSPEVWDVFLQRSRETNITIVGISAYDLNEMRLTPDRATYVPLSETLSDLWSFKIDTDLRYRLLSQYAMKYLRLVYPIAGDADKVLVALRRKAAEQLGLKVSLDEHEGVLAEQTGVLNVQDATSLNEWSAARIVRRLAALRAENHGLHQFTNGPKSRALLRLLSRARRRGPVVVIVMPVSEAYAREFLDDRSMAAFETAVSGAMAVIPDATVVRVDRLPGISDHRFFADLVHMNSEGRRLATSLFLKEVSKSGPTPKAETALANGIGQPWQR